MTDATPAPSGVDLFTPIEIGPITLRHRVVMAPLTRNRAGPGDVPRALNTEYYSQRAGAAMIISEATPVSAEAVGYPATPGIYSEAQVAAWQDITGAVHGEGGVIFSQLWYCGRISHPDLLPDGRQPVAPSAIRPQGEAVTYTGMQPFVEPRALATEELPGIVEQYHAAAANARAAGFDGIEVHAANGYLLDQFLRDSTNRRSGAYGGPARNRMRLLLEVIDAVTRVWEPGRVGVRISPENSFNDIGDSDPQATFEAVAGELSAYGLAYLHVVEGDMMSGERSLDYRRIKDRFGGPYMANNAYDFERAQAAVGSGAADLVSFGKPYLANPDLAERFRAHAALNEPDPETFYGGDAHGYTDYPFMS